MTNKDFIEKFGRREFNDICKDIYQRLFLMKCSKKIKSFKINNTQNKATLFKNDKTVVTLDFATIFFM